MQQAAEVKVGIFVLAVAFLGLVIATNLKGGLGGKARGYDFEIWFETAPSVGKGSAVRLAGVDIGEVIDKDIIRVTESASYGPPSVQTVLPLEMIKTWTVGRAGSRDFAQLEVARKPVSYEEAQKAGTVQRERSVARMKVRVKRQYDMYSLYRYEIIGGVVFGDKMLNISDVGTDGLPLSADERGQSIRAERARGRRVVVLGKGPASLDQIVSNVNKSVDEDTVARVKRIVANIETTTDQAGAMMTALRGTVDANRGNADRMMGNFAAASEDVQKAMGQVRLQAGQILGNVDRLTAAGKRVAESNEGKINRSLSHVEDTTATFARAARNSEGKIDKTVTDVQAIAREVRNMIASNRENIDNVMGKLSGIADDVKQMTGASKGRVESIMTKVDDSVGKVRDLLDKSDSKLAGIIDDTHTMVADARDTMKAVKESVGPVTDNLRETSQNLNTASRNVAGLTSDPAAKQTLHNVERATAEARDLLNDIRSLTSDPKVQEDIRATTKSVRNVAERLDKGIGGFGQYRPTAFTDVYYVPQTSTWRSDINLTILGKKQGKTTYSYHLGFDNVTVRPVVDFQLGRTLFSDDIRVRYGYYRGRLGVGADLTFSKNLWLRTDLYNPKDLQLNSKAYYRTKWGLAGMVGVDDMLDRFNFTMGVQLGKDFH